MNLIHHIPKAYSLQSCKLLIDWFESNIEKASPGDVGKEKLNNLEITLEIKTLESYFNLGNCLSDSIKKFISKYPLLNKNINKWKLNNFAQLMKYEPNNYYNVIHCENDGDSRYLKRVFAWMIFLNDIKEGGGTKFIFQDYTAQPIAGDFYIWSAYWTHLHQGINAPKENKYIITGWCDYE